MRPTRKLSALYLTVDGTDANTTKALGPLDGSRPDILTAFG